MKKILIVIFVLGSVSAIAQIKPKNLYVSRCVAKPQETVYDYSYNVVVSAVNRESEGYVVTSKSRRKARRKARRACKKMWRGCSVVCKSVVGG